MTDTVQTPTATWTQNPDGSWGPARTVLGGVVGISGKVEVYEGFGPPSDLLPVGAIYIDLNVYAGSFVGGDTYSDGYGSGYTGTLGSIGSGDVYSDGYGGAYGTGDTSSTVGIWYRTYAGDIVPLFDTATTGGSSGNIDGGQPDTIYGGLDGLTGGSP